MNSQRHSTDNTGGSHEIPAEPTSTKLLNELLEASFSKRGEGLTGGEWSLLREELEKSEASQTELLESATRVIEAFLSQRFPKTLANKSNLRQISENIAKTLCVDPFSKQRLAEFLQHLRNSGCGA